MDVNKLKNEAASFCIDGAAYIHSETLPGRGTQNVISGDGAAIAYAISTLIRRTAKKFRTSKADVLGGVAQLVMGSDFDVFEAFQDFCDQKQNDLNPEEINQYKELLKKDSDKAIAKLDREKEKFIDEIKRKDSIIKDLKERLEEQRTESSKHQRKLIKELNAKEAEIRRLFNLINAKEENDGRP